MHGNAYGIVRGAVFLVNRLISHNFVHLTDQYHHVYNITARKKTA